MYAFHRCSRNQLHFSEKHEIGVVVERGFLFVLLLDLFEGGVPYGIHQCDKKLVVPVPLEILFVCNFPLHA